MVNGGYSILTMVIMDKDCATVSHGEDSISFEAGVTREKVKSEKAADENIEDMEVKWVTGHGSNDKNIRDAVGIWVRLGMNQKPGYPRKQPE
jgi:hypothetical protein